MMSWLVRGLPEQSGGRVCSVCVSAGGLASLDVFERGAAGSGCSWMCGFRAGREFG